MLIQDGTTITVADTVAGAQQPDKNANGGGAQQPQMVQMSQADFDRIIGERVNRAKGSASEELLKALGVESPDQAKDLIKKAQDAAAAQMTETQKLQAEIEKAKKEAEQARKDREQADALRQETLLRFAVMQEAMKPEHNLNPHAVGDIWTLIDKSEIKLDETGKATGIDKALQALTKSKPYLVNGNGNAAKQGTPLRQRTVITPSPAAQPAKTVSKL